MIKSSIKYAETATPIITPYSDNSSSTYYILDLTIFSDTFMEWTVTVHSYINKRLLIAIIGQSVREHPTDATNTQLMAPIEVRFFNVWAWVMIINVGSEKWVKKLWQTITDTLFLFICQPDYEALAFLQFLWDFPGSFQNSVPAWI